MPRNALPRVSRHASGQARVHINGKDHYLGIYGSPEAEIRYRELLGEHLRKNGLSPNPDNRQRQAVTVRELTAAYAEFAKTYYRKNGEPTTELRDMLTMVDLLNRECGDLRCSEFGPRRLKSIRETMIESGWCRTLINQRVRRIVRIFRYGSEDELIPPEVYHGLKSVQGLRRGRSEAPESPPVQPVPQHVVDATLPHLSRQVAAMVRLQLFTAMRPGEVCIMRPCDIIRSEKVWKYVPESHKMEHEDRPRNVFLGPKAQEVLWPWLDRDPEAYCFSPREAVEDRFRELRTNRKTPVQPSQRYRRKASWDRQPSEVYCTSSYGYAIERTCKKHGIPPWRPNRLRHTAATRIRREFGLEAAQTVLGHASADITTLYAERDANLAIRAMFKLG